MTNLFLLLEVDRRRVGEHRGLALAGDLELGHLEGGLEADERSGLKRKAEEVGQRVPVPGGGKEGRK